MKRRFLLAFVGVVLLVSIAGAQDRRLAVNPPAARRVALVIGNGTYMAAPLKNPVNDARDIAQALRDLGFDVEYGENLGRNDMKRSIRAFGERLRGASDVALFYFAGHGVQVKGVNYLIPIDARVEREEEVEYEGVEAGFVLAQMEADTSRVNIVILDACRNNPFARSFRSASNGLAALDAPSGTLIAYATGPGSTASDGDARNGLYTQELLKHMRVPGLSVEEVFKRVRISVRAQTRGRQTPWESSSLTGDFRFIGGGRSTPPEIVIPASRFIRGSNVEVGGLRVYGTNIVHNAAPYFSGTPNEVEYRITVDSGGTYDLSVQLAALEPRPVDIVLNGTVAFRDALAVTSGSWNQSDAKWFSVGRLYLQPGNNSLVVKRADAFPHLLTLRLTPVMQ